MADACRFLMELPEERFSLLLSAEHPPLVNIGCGEDVTIRELAETVKDVVGFKGRLRFDATKPDGTPRKLLDIDRLRQLGWKPETAFKDGIACAYQDFLSGKDVDEL